MVPEDWRFGKKLLGIRWGWGERELHVGLIVDFADPWQTVYRRQSCCCS